MGRPGTTFGPGSGRRGTSVLVVEDTATVRRLIAALLVNEGFDVVEAEGGRQALDQVDRTMFDVVLLDIELPDLDGLTICRQLRGMANAADAYIVIVSGRSNETDRIDGLGAGADDYVVKPFSPEELVLRVQAMLRRPRRRVGDHPTPTPNSTTEERGYPGRASPSRTAERPDGAAGERSPELPVGDLVINRANQCVAVAGTSVELTSTEFQLLLALAEQAGTVVPRGRLIEACWGDSPVDDHHLLSVHMANLRRKIDPDGVRIVTRRGVGYQLATPQTTSP